MTNEIAAEAEKNMVETMRYLEERAQKIQLSSDKLRNELEKLDKVVTRLTKETGVGAKVEIAYDPEEMELTNVFIGKRDDGYGIAIERGFDRYWSYKWAIYAPRDDVVSIVKCLPNLLKFFGENLLKKQNELEDSNKQLAKILEKLEI